MTATPRQDISSDSRQLLFLRWAKYKPAHKTGTLLVWSSWTRKVVLLPLIWINTRRSTGGHLLQLFSTSLLRNKDQRDVWFCGKHGREQRGKNRKKHLREKLFWKKIQYKSYLFNMNDPTSSALRHSAFTFFCLFLWTAQQRFMANANSVFYFVWMGYNQVFWSGYGRS